MGRRTEGWPTIADYSVWTNELSREELMIIIDGIRNHRINQAKRKLQFCGRSATGAEPRGVNTGNRIRLFRGGGLKQRKEIILTDGSRSCHYFIEYG